MSSIISRGWVEVLFNTEKNKPSPLSFDSIEESQYVQIGSRMPIAEVDGPYDIYQMLFEGSLRGPRAVRSFDLINVVLPNKRNRTYVILSPEHDRPFFERVHKQTKQTLKCACWPQFPHGITELPTAFSSFSIKANS